MTTTPAPSHDEAARRAAIRRTVLVLVLCSAAAYGLFFYSVVAGK